MSTIIHLHDYHLKERAISRIIELGEAAEAIDNVPFDTLSKIRLMDHDGIEISAYEAIVRATLALLETIHKMDGHYAEKRIERCLTEEGRIAP